jgi:recombination protein RecT
MAQNNQVAPAADNPPSTYGNAANQVAKITDSEMARKMVLKYATDLVGKERAREFFMHMAFLERTNPNIARCTPQSKFKSMMEAVNLNLMPNTADQFCALVPYGSELQLQPMYKGGMELAYRSGQVRTIKAENVFAEDEFDYDDAMNTIKHKKALDIDRTDVQKIKAVYAVAHLKDGEVMFEVVSPSEIRKIKDKAVKATGGKTPWAEWEERMYRKTAMKRLLAILPKSATDNRLSQFIKIDDAREAGKPTDIDLETGNIIEGEVASEDDKKAETRKRIEAAEAKKAELDKADHKPKAVKTAKGDTVDTETGEVIADGPGPDAADADIEKLENGTLLDDVEVPAADKAADK